MPRLHRIQSSEAEICDRVRQVREAVKLTRVAFAREAGIDSSTLSNIEHKRSPLRYAVGKAICNTFFVNPFWLAFGKEPLAFSLEDTPIDDSSFSEPLDGGALFSGVIGGPLGQHLRQQSEQDHLRCERAIKGDISEEELRAISERYTNEDARRFLVQRIRAARAYKHRAQQISFGEDDEVDEFILRRYLNTVISREAPWNDLRSRTSAVTAERGAKSKLARFLGVTPQSVHEWLSGKSAPTADTTLRLLLWVTEAEGKQKKSLGGAGTHPRQRPEKDEPNAKGHPSSG